MNRRQFLILVLALLVLGAAVLALGIVFAVQQRQRRELALLAAPAVVIVTEWVQFRGLDLDRLKSVMAQPVVVDEVPVVDEVVVQEPVLEEPVVEAVTEEVAAELTRIDRAFVIDRDTAFSLRGRPFDPHHDQGGRRGRHVRQQPRRIVERRRGDLAAAQERADPVTVEQPRCRHASVSSRSRQSDDAGMINPRRAN